MDAPRQTCTARQLCDCKHREFIQWKIVMPCIYAARIVYIFFSIPCTFVISFSSLCFCLAFQFSEFRAVFRVQSGDTRTICLFFLLSIMNAYTKISENLKRERKKREIIIEKNKPNKLMNAERLKHRALNPKEMPMRDCLLCRDDDHDERLRGRNSNIILWWTVKWWIFLLFHVPPVARHNHWRQQFLFMEIFN